MMTEKNLKFTDPAREQPRRNLAGMTEGFVGSDLESLCREAGMLALREGASVGHHAPFRGGTEEGSPDDER